MYSKNLTILILSSILSLTSCSLLENKEHHDSGTGDEDAARKVEYLSFDEALNELKQRDASDTTVSNTIHRGWLWQNIYANIPRASVEQRDALTAYLDSLQEAPVHSGSQFMTEDMLETPDQEQFSFSLPSHHTVRIPVTSFCLNSNKGSPSSTLRYKLKPQVSESLSRQILFKYLEGRDDDATFQSLMWRLEDQELALKDVPTFMEILDKLNVPYDENWVLKELDQQPDFMARVQEIGVGSQRISDDIQVSLISTDGYKSGHLLLFNTSDSDSTTISPEDINLVMEPLYEQARDATPKELEEQYQSIYVSGSNPSQGSTTEMENQNVARDLNDLSSRLDSVVESGSLSPEDADFLEVAEQLNAEFAAQGEYEAAQNFTDQLNDLAGKLETGADIATALTPGVNDIRDLYETFSGKDMITGEELDGWERAASAVGIVAGSGAAFRKGFDAIARSLGLSADSYNKGRHIVDSATNANPITTPYGDAIQDMSRSAVKARANVERGDKVFRIGTRNRSETGETGQFWSLEHPSTPGYAQKYGIPQQNIDRADFIEIGTIKPGSPYVTRRAPGSPDGRNSGGGIEVVTSKGSVNIESHSSIGD